ncbi:energy transducer TonB [Oceanobacter mangrovi]|uniref:energy transducer TonB n=1 Tax=Oceanobacter mangrovi TaxID=2862510 RepID=UPI001C8E6521|nr:energy transducer TonB [Oceanobacter mangrovi]
MKLMAARIPMLLATMLLVITTGCTTTTVTARSGFDVPQTSSQLRGNARWLGEGNIKPSMSVAPEYSRELINGGEEGEVRLEVQVLPTGQVALVKLLDTTNKKLVDSATRGIRGVLYDPVLKGQNFVIKAVYRIQRPN